MAFAPFSYYFRNLLSARRTDNFVVHVEPDDDADGKPRYSLDTSTRVGQDILKELTSTTSGTSSIKNAKQLTQDFLHKYPGLASIKIQLGDDMIQSSGDSPANVNICKQEMPGVRKVKVRDSGRIIIIRCNKAVKRATQILTVELGDRHGNWWECSKGEWKVQMKGLGKHACQAQARLSQQNMVLQSTSVSAL